MKLKKLTLWCVATIMLLLCSCEKQGNYENALPKDAALVVQADFASMVDKSGLNREGGKKALRHLGDVLKSGMEGSDELIDKIMENPDESGLELSEKVYFFVEPKSERIGLLAKVSDKDRLKELMKTLRRQGIAEDTHSGDGCSWTAMGNVLLAYNATAFLALADPAGGEARDNLHAAEMLLRQGDGQGFTATDGYAEMMKKQGDFLAFVSLNILPSSLPSLMTMGLSAELNLDDVRYVASLNFISGKAVLDVTSVTTDAVVKDLIAKQQKAISKLKGKYLDAFPANTLFWMSCNADGAGIYSLLCENPIVKQQMDNPMMPVDVESVFSAIKGDVALAFTDLSGQHFIAYADVTGPEFLSTFEDLKPILALTGGMFKLINDGSNAYEFRMPRNMGGVFSRIWFGVKDNRLYVTNDKELVDARVLGLSLRANPWGKAVEGQAFYMALNANVIHQTFSEMMAGEGMASQLLNILSGLDYLTVESAEGVDYRAELVLKDKGKNFLQYLWQN